MRKRERESRMLARSRATGGKKRFFDDGIALRRRRKKKRRQNSLFSLSFSFFLTRSFTCSLLSLSLCFDTLTSKSTICSRQCRRRRCSPEGVEVSLPLLRASAASRRRCCRRRRRRRGVLSFRSDGDEQRARLGGRSFASSSQSDIKLA